MCLTLKSLHVIDSQRNGSKKVPIGESRILYGLDQWVCVKFKTQRKPLYISMGFFSNQKRLSQIYVLCDVIRDHDIWGEIKYEKKNSRFFAL